MNGLGNQMSAQAEREANKAAMESFYARATERGKHPGTHTLGEEFNTKKEKAKK